MPPSEQEEFEFRARSEREAGKPAAVKAAAPAAPEPTSPTSGKNLAGAAVEPMMSIASGAVAAPLSGIAGMAGTMLPGQPGQGAEWQRKISEAMTYQPRTTGGQNAMSAISAPFELAAKGARRAGEATADTTGSPLAGTTIDTLLQALPQLLGVKGARGAMGGADRVMENIGPELGLRKPPGMPSMSPDVAALAKRDIPMTPGQMGKPGGMLSRLEEGAQSIPLAGDAVKGARTRSVEALNKEAWNDALKPVGKTAPKNMTGEELSAYTRSAYNDAYDGLLSKMKGALDNKAAGNALPGPQQLGQPPKPTYRQELDNLLQMAGQNGGLPPREMRVLRRVIDKDIKDKFNSYGLANGETMQGVQATLRNERQTLERSSDYYQRQLGTALKEVESATWRMLEDQNPKLAGDKRRIDDGYARFKIAQQAAGAIGSKEGTFKPSAYDRAVRNKDATKDKRAFSEGTARQQDLSGPGKRVLSDTLPDSGTPFRGAMMEAAAHPAKAALLATTLGIPLHVLYSPQGIAMMQRMMMGQGPQVGRGLGTALPIGAAQAGQLPPPPQ